MNTLELEGQLLASVSRSFYLSIRVLPGLIRAPIGLAYLLARASDTIADTEDVPAEIRLQHLAAFAGMIQRGTTEGLGALQRDIRPEHAGERTLIDRLGDALEWLATISSFDRTEILIVMERIIRGQTLDLKRFAAVEEVVALGTAEELEEYTYLVAGCVGEFWTRICLHHLADYSRIDAEPLRELGVNYGKGLQLVNILRDLRADLRSGRCYLPEDELRAAGTSPRTLFEHPEAGRPVFNRWHARAQALLDDGRSYIEALQPARLRIGCFLPWYLGVKTLALLVEKPPLETPERVKVPRSTVRAALAFAPLIAVTNRALGWVK
ncbi:MAG TPA: squalene/phytoene synthase family protein [Chthoniobacteraceae bacterium]|jgi:farnesyl-diphosphate farnesyltransferase